MTALLNASRIALSRSVPVGHGALTVLGIEPVEETAAQFRTCIAAQAKEGAALLKDAGFRPE